MRLDMLLCEGCSTSCSGGNASPCHECDRRKHPNHQLCLACAISNDCCQGCGMPMNTQIVLAVEEVTAARSVLAEALDEAEAAFRDEIASFQQEAEAYEDGLADLEAAHATAAVSEKAAFEEAVAALQTKLQSSANADSERSAVAEAQRALRAVRQEANVTYQQGVAELREAFAEHIAAYETATRNRNAVQQRAERIFNLKMSQLLGHYEVDKAYRDGMAAAIAS